MISVTRHVRPAVKSSRRRQVRRVAWLDFDRLDDRVMLTVSGGTTLGIQAIAGAPFPSSVVHFSVDTTTNAGVTVQNATPGAIGLDESGNILVTPHGLPSPYGFRPSQISKAYGFDQTTLSNGIVGDGAGQTIVILDAYDNPNIINDLHQFNLAFGLPDPPSFTVYKQTVNGNTPAPNANWALEIALDVQWAHAMAPKANIILAEAYSATTTDLFATAQYMAAQPGVSVISMSFGANEWSSEMASDSTFVTPNGHGGVTYVASSGDGGVVSYPAVSPRVLGIGGTSLTLDANNNYVSETAWSGSGGGTSQYEAKPSYQNGVVSGSFRQSPDVSLVADPSTGVAVYDSYNNGSTTPWTVVGGTSASAPIWASLIAIANQGRAVNGLTSLDGFTQTLPMLYQMPASNFRDITSGSNNNGSAKAGYDVVTGLGSPRVNLVVTALSGTPSTPNPTAPSVLDASFETVSVASDGYRYNPTGSAWTFAGSSGLVNNGVGFTSGNAAPSGSQVAFLQVVGSISQTITGWTAGNYTISFAAAKRNYAGNQDFQVLVDGNVVGTFKPDSTTYKTYTTSTFAVTAGSHTITFKGLNTAGGDNTSLIDTVAVATTGGTVTPPPPAPSAPAVVDASFETVSVASDGYRYNPTGSAWTFAGSSGLVNNGVGFTSGNAAPSGSQVAFLQVVGSISQTITGWTAGNYTISFAAAKRNYAGNQDFQVLVDGNVVGTFKPDSTTYKTYTTSTFAVGAGSHTITFKGLNTAGGDNTSLIDTVAVATSNSSVTNGIALGGQAARGLNPSSASFLLPLEGVTTSVPSQPTPRVSKLDFRPRVAAWKLV